MVMLAVSHCAIHLIFMLDVAGERLLAHKRLVLPCFLRELREDREGGA